MVCEYIQYNVCYTGKHVEQYFTVMHGSVTELMFSGTITGARADQTWRASTGCALIGDRVVECLTCRRMKMTT